MNKYKRICCICKKEWGNPEGKHLYTFCPKCLRDVKNDTFLESYIKKRGGKNAT